MDRGPVERQDGGDYAVGFVNHPGLNGALVHDLAVQRVGEPRVIVEARVTIGQVEAQGIAARLADLAGLKLGQLPGSPLTTRALCRPVAGSITANVSASPTSANAPPMKALQTLRPG